MRRARWVVTALSHVAAVTSFVFAFSGLSGWGYPDATWFPMVHVILTVGAVVLALAALPTSVSAVVVSGIVLLVSWGVLSHLESTAQAWCAVTSPTQSSEPGPDNPLALVAWGGPPHLNLVDGVAECTTGPERRMPIVDLFDR